MFKLMISITVVALVLLVTLGIRVSCVEAEYVRTYGCHWTLAEKASTIAAKQDKIAAFVDALEAGRAHGDFAANDAIFFPTPNNAMVDNLEMVKTLSQRLSEIKAMDPKSFEYQTAIQQITAQEQGEAHAMTGVFYGCWLLQSHFLLWDWARTAAIVVLVTIALLSALIAFQLMLDK